MQKKQHITDKELQILHCFYKQKTFHVRQLQKTTQLSEHTLLKYLRILEEKKLLISEKQGNLKQFHVNLQNSFTKIFFAYFDLQKLQELEYKRRIAIEGFVSKLKETKLPYFILLFGSTAKGSYLPSSDIDVLIVYEDYAKELLFQLETLVKDLFAETGLRFNTILMRLNEFLKEKNNKTNYALQDALQAGYPLFGNTLFYEVFFQ